jgi:hypothetical protein
MRAARYTMIRNTLYQMGYTLPLLKCISRTNADYVLWEIHEGVCSSHAGCRMLAHKLVKSGYYWPRIWPTLCGIVTSARGLPG